MAIISEHVRRYEKSEDFFGYYFTFKFLFIKTPYKRRHLFQIKIEYEVNLFKTIPRLLYKLRPSQRA
jgi:hypothetical protein